MSRFFTSESVTEGHPDKIADQISDSVLDALLAEDPKSRVACETYVTTGLVLVGGEVTTEAYADIARIARDRVLEIGYDSSVKGFDGESCAVQITLDAQSPDIAQGVDTAFENRADGSVDPLDLQGAGDQGLMFGFAIDETPELMPLPITIAHRLAEQLTAVRKDGTLPYLRADGKTQVTIEYGDDDKPKRVEAIVVSTQHEEGIDLDAQLRGDIKKHVIDVVLGQYDIDSSDYKLHVNPTGRFVIGGPMGDVGLTGRKIIVDTYGGYARHGGGAFSGKDPSKVDRSAAYAMRWVAKNIVAAGLARRCTIQLAYAIGVSEPLSLYVDTHGTAADGVTDEGLENAIRGIGKLGGLTPRGIRTHLGLNKPIYRKSAAYGHFGREVTGDHFPWERTDLVEDLKAAMG